ncbi:MAG: hypothetical protein ACFCVG_07870 [Kineosporiaceae bacterium]
MVGRGLMVRWGRGGRLGREVTVGLGAEVVVGADAGLDAEEAGAGGLG